ncbi:MAG: hypothetical protein WBA31_07040 [Candidatus Dormiibacterota bacterium]
MNPPVSREDSPPPHAVKGTAALPFGSLDVTAHGTVAVVDDWFLVALLAIGLAPVILSFLLGLWVRGAWLLLIGFFVALVTMRLAAMWGIRAYQPSTDADGPPAARRLPLPGWGRRLLLWLLVAR